MEDWRQIFWMATESGLDKPKTGKSLRLETGNTLAPAHRLYERHGFQFCGPFGDYVANDTSLFMEKKL